MLVTMKSGFTPAAEETDKMLDVEDFLCRFANGRFVVGFAKELFSQMNHTLLCISCKLAERSEVWSCIFFWMWIFSHRGSIFLKK